MSTIRTHRGFIMDVQSKEPEGFVSLQLADKLYQKMETSDNFEHRFDFIQDVVRAAKQSLFTSDGRFVLLNQLKCKPPHWVLKFSISTLCYINGQMRQIAVENYRDLMPFHPKDEVSVDFSSVVRDNNLGWMFKATPGEIIAAWLAQEDGLTDLVMTLQLVAGELPDGWHDRSDAA